MDVLFVKELAEVPDEALAEAVALPVVAEVAWDEEEPVCRELLCSEDNADRSRGWTSNAKWPRYIVDWLNLPPPHGDDIVIHMVRSDPRSQVPLYRNLVTSENQ